LSATVLQHVEAFTVLHLHLFWTCAVRHLATTFLAGLDDDLPTVVPNTPTASHAAATVAAYPPANVRVHSRALRKVERGVRQDVFAL
jgi:hypothetical protein